MRRLIEAYRLKSFVNQGVQTKKSRAKTAKIVRETRPTTEFRCN